jgi:hypothetical protein
MGVLTDFVVASVSDAQRVGESSSCPSRDFDGLDAKGIDTVKLGSLYSVLTGEPTDPGLSGRCTLLFMASDEGPWVMQVPEDLVKLLAELAPKELGSVAAAWAQTEEFSPAYENWPVTLVQEVLEGIAELCRQAVAEGKAVLMWMCL